VPNLQKNSDRAQFCNYRPISILPSFWKIYEKLICNKLMNYLSKHSILYNDQYGFRSHGSHWCGWQKLLVLWILTNFLLDYSLTYQNHLTLQTVKLRYVALRKVSQIHVTSLSLNGNKWRDLDVIIWRWIFFCCTNSFRAIRKSIAVIKKFVY